VHFQRIRIVILRLIRDKKDHVDVSRDRDHLLKTAWYEGEAAESITVDGREKHGLKENAVARNESRLYAGERHAGSTNKRKGIETSFAHDETREGITNSITGGNMNILLKGD